MSCYLRPDFLLNFIMLAADKDQANRIFDRMFPTLMGISISHHVSPEICEAVHGSITSHKETASSRVKAQVGTMSTMLMTKQLPAKAKTLRHFLDEGLES